MNFSFHPDAERELNTAINFYEQHQEGLGYDFSLEVHAAIDRAVMHLKKEPGYWNNRI